MKIVNKNILKKKSNRLIKNQLYKMKFYFNGFLEGKKRLQES
jgi:hypothetical protein